jgi:hypothetical protein
MFIVNTFSLFDRVRYFNPKCVLNLTGNRISRLFLPGSAKGGIEKMRSIFFQRAKAAVFRLRPGLHRGGGKSNVLSKSLSGQNN